jgi:hypothetical protein
MRGSVHPGVRAHGNLILDSKQLVTSIMLQLLLAISQSTMPAQQAREGPKAQKSAHRT